MPSSFRALDAARSVVDEINDLLDRPGRPLIHRGQLRDSAGAITSNIREALGRRAGPERNQFYRYADGSVDETDEWLRGNWRSRRIDRVVYLRLHNRLVAISKMLVAIMRG